MQRIEQRQRPKRFAVAKVGGRSSSGEKETGLKAGEATEEPCKGWGGGAECQPRFTALLPLCFQASTQRSCRMKVKALEYEPRETRAQGGRHETEGVAWDRPSLPATLPMC